MSISGSDGAAMIFFEWQIAVSSKSRLAGFDIQNKARYSRPAECPYCGDEIASGDWLPPHRIAFDSPTVGDFASNGTSFVLSDSCVAAVRAAKVTGLGISQDPVEGTGGDGVFFAGFPKPVLTRLNERESGVDVTEVSGCERCRVFSRRKVDRLRIDETTWNGEDVFRPSGLFGVVVVTQKFVEIIREGGFENFHFVHQDDFREDWSLLLG